MARNPLEEEQNDGLDDAILAPGRQAGMIGMQSGNAITRMIQERQRAQREQLDQQAHDLQRQLEAKWQADRQSLEQTHRDDWWGSSTIEQQHRAYQTAAAWSEEHPEAARTAEHVRDQMQARHGVDPAAQEHAASIDPNAVERDTRERVADREREEVSVLNAQAVEEEAAAAAERDVEPGREEAGESERISEADHMRAEAGSREDLARGEDARADALPYDSRERRETTAEGLRSSGVDERAVDAQMHADTSQGRPATEAVSSERGSAPKARARRGNVRGRTNQGRQM